MAEKARLRQNRRGTVINLTSKQQETQLGQAVIATSEKLAVDFPYVVRHRKSVLLSEIVAKLRSAFPMVDFHEPFTRSSMNPDGGMLYLTDSAGEQYPILISEAKNQGTNDLRAQEGLRKQAKGNAIERLGKNVIGFRTMMLTETINPFVCFGYGIDFEDASSILDRVITIAMFGKLNAVHLMNEGDQSQFDRGSFYFRRSEWTKDEMVDVMYDIGSRAIHYYIAKHGSDKFSRIALAES